VQRISGRQCKASRSLLKWNIHDLVNRLKDIEARRIEGFERNTLQLLEWENQEILTVLKKHGIIFTNDSEVILDKTADNSEAVNMTHGEGARIILNNDLTIVSDSTILEEKKRLFPIAEEKKDEEE